MKTLLIAVFALLASTTSHAADSAWLLCSSNNLVVNSLEHRTGADNRATSIALIYGMYILKGELQETDSGAVALSGSEKGDVKEFNGTMSFDYSKYTVTLNGALNLGGEVQNIKTKLKCKEMGRL